MIYCGEDLELGGYRLRRHIFRPESGTPIRGSAFHFHGQGDFAGRYGKFLQPFWEKGIVCVATDLPGHGHSHGIRGHVPGFEIVDRVAESNRTRCRELVKDDDAPSGILGHSAGGLMTLREILLNPDLYDFSWISSPLVRPDANQHPALVRLAGLIARIFPRFTISTGVNHAKCSRQPDHLHKSGDSKHIHSRVSASWGHSMIKGAGWMRKTIRNAPPRMPILITQGLLDPVCPPEHLHALLEGASLPRLTLREFPEALHEPFSDDTRGELFQEISEWIEKESILQDTP